MRLREWYGWHFPELAKILTDNLVYAKTVAILGVRTKAPECDLESLLPDGLEQDVREAAQISMGTEITEKDELFIMSLAEQVIELSEYRHELNEYLQDRMSTIAPNLSNMVGELVGSRLIAHAGSLINLAKCPASTLQILGAEKALFKAIRTKKNTPKYGLIYNASMIGQCSAGIKGKVARALAAKCSLCVRMDALGEDV
jgi:nucleolar protein 58